MKKIIVIGCPGGGKSTFSRALNEKIGIPVYHLDLMFWNADKTTVDRGIFLARLRDVLNKDEWIIDGNYASTMEERILACDTVIFLDYPLETCLLGVKERCGKVRSDMPWVETEEDAEFIDFINNFTLQQRPQILDLLEKYSEKDVMIFKSREEANEFLRRKK